MSKFRAYTFTDFVLDKKFLTLENLKAQYIYYGEEICPETKKKHFQGWVYFTNPRSFKSIQKLLKPRHIEPMNGTVEQNIAYCKKDGIVTELGEKPAQGNRTDLEELKDMIKDGAKAKDIFEAQPGNYIRYHRGIEKAMNLYKIKRNWKMDVRIYWGPPESGKTKKVYEEFNSEDIYQKPTGKWWDGYDGEKVVIIDDFDPNNCFDITYDFYLRLLDRYPMQVEYKGGMTQFNSKVIIITSNFNPEEWFEHKKNRQAFFRRITEIRHIT